MVDGLHRICNMESEPAPIIVDVDRKSTHVNSDWTFEVQLRGQASLSGVDAIDIRT